MLAGFLRAGSEFVVTLAVCFYIYAVNDLSSENFYMEGSADSCISEETTLNMLIGRCAEMLPRFVFCQPGQSGLMSFRI